MEPSIVVALVTGSVVLLGAIATLAAALYKSRNDRLSERERRMDARYDSTIQQLDTDVQHLRDEVASVKTDLATANQRVEELEEREKKRSSAFGRILRQIANQWPDPHGPNLDPADIAEVEDTIPSQWIRRGTT